LFCPRLHADVQAILSQHAVHAHIKDFKHKTTSSASNLSMFFLQQSMPMNPMIRKVLADGYAWVSA
jgi:hypothetical protein